MPARCMRREVHRHIRPVQQGQQAPRHPGGRLRPPARQLCTCTVQRGEGHVPSRVAWTVLSRMLPR